MAEIVEVEIGPARCPAGIGPGAVEVSGLEGSAGPGGEEPRLGLGAGEALKVVSDGGNDVGGDRKRADARIGLGRSEYWRLTHRSRPRHVRVDLALRTYTPVLIDAGFPELDITVSWWGGQRLRFGFPPR